MKRIAVVWRVSPGESESDFITQTRAQLGADQTLSKPGILVASVYNGTHEGQGVWTISPVFAFIELGGKVFFDSRNGRDSIEATMLTMLPDFYDQFVDTYGPVEAHELAVDTVRDEIGGAVCSLAYLNAKNIHTVTIDAPEKLNKKRSKLGKMPMFEYKVLDIFLGADKQIHRDRIQNALKSRPSYRLHTVRGHFKIRKTGIFWWSDFARGNKASGKIVKDYAIHTDVFN